MENKYTTQHLGVNWREGQDHRGVIGGLWEEIGQLQFSYIKAQGLKPNHRLLDIGCGSFRGGTHFVPYLDADRYFGFDINRSLIDAGIAHEVSDLDRENKINPDNFYAGDNFEFPSHWKDIDFALSVSLFTHLKMNTIRQCLVNAHPLLKPGSHYHSTVFTVPDTDLHNPVEQSPGIITYAYKDPYHYTREDINYLACTSGYHLRSIDDFGHPRAQKMAIFERI